MLEVNINKRVKGFSLSASWSTDGDLTCLFGYTGSGKSLTLKMIAGLTEPDTGSISFNGKLFYDSDANINIPPQERCIGFVFQENLLFPHLTVFENILYGLSGKENDKQKRVSEVIKVLRLESLEEKYPHQISGGQRQRTAIGRAVIRKPELLLLDEPFNSLDHAVRKKMHKDLKYYQQYFGVPIILVTHDMDELHSLADHVVLLSDGVVVQTGSPESVFSEPACRMSARLVGTKNILDGKVTGEEWGQVKVSTEKYDLYSANCEGFKTGDKVICCIRPECVSIVDDSAEGENLIDGSVEEIVKNADTYDLFLKSSDNGYDLEMKVSKEVFVRSEIFLKKPIKIRIDPKNVHLIKQ